MKMLCFRYSEFCYEFTDSVVVNEEFVKVICTSDDGSTVIYKDFFAFPQNPYKPGDPQYNNGPGSDRLSVLMIGFDGVSRLNFVRQMPRTTQYLDEQDAISLLGYNKVGYNTFPNVVPVLTGMSEAGLQKNCWPDKQSVFDNCTFIWDQFKSQGYVTSYGEDAPSIGTFYFLKRGFRKKPVDYYPRPFSLQVENETGTHHRLNIKLCMGKQISSQVYNDLIKSYAYRMKNQLSFGFFWTNSLTHDYLNLPRIGDQAFKEVLTFLKRDGIFNRTAIILLSDHGMRWGSFRTTYQGFLEERLPFVYFLFPQWFKEKYSTALANLHLNRKRLTSPYDIHETLKDLVNLTRISNEYFTNRRIKQDMVSKTSRLGQSLFRPISPDRSCKNAGIPEEWCSCHTNKPLSITSKESQEAAAAVVLQINSLLSGYRQCADLKMSKLVTARLEEVPNKESLKYLFKDYIVTLETSPGHGLFEATVRYSHNAGFTVIGAISRLNMYGNQSSCISNYLLKLYCFCENQWGI
ncbi:unnamed protein product [Nesidiocoris tenuis]|uniref:Sulfatase N-terminal domain-containing protein n=1 Tax=Nesidiocoris tenuis TaxID=355587 RepID=A0A6H5HK01_9HEMI|nr:unnamed protein product [Nesidiocoris tenuis]